MSQLRAMMVDLDGTLADTASANWEAYRAALTEVGVFLSKVEFDARVQGHHWTEFLPGILAEASSPAEAASVARRKGEIYSAMASNIQINVALIEIITNARLQLKTALVTSAAKRSVTALLSAHSLADLFDTVVTGEDVKRHKPDPEAYQVAAARLGVSPQECVIFEDSEIGVMSARAFGGHVLQIVFQPKQAPANLL